MYHTSMAAPQHGRSDFTVFTTKAPPAVPKVLNTPELLEQILLALPSLDAITARGVCKYWRTSSEGSKALRQHIFLEAAPTTELFSWDLKAGNTRYTPVIRACETDRQLTEDDVPVRRLHPLLRRSPLREIPYSCRWIDFVLAADVEDLKDINGTWRDMLICQPPCCFGDLFIFSTLRFTYGDEAGKRKARDLVTLGGLVDFVVENCFGKARGGVRIMGSVLVDGDHANKARGNKDQNSVYTAKLGCCGRARDLLYGFKW